MTYHSRRGPEACLFPQEKIEFWVSKTEFPYVKKKRILREFDVECFN